MSATTTLTLQMPLSISEKLERLAQATSRSPDSVAVDALSAYLELQEWQVREIQEGLDEAEAGEFASDEEVTRVFERWRNSG